jgi:1-acyl-sn-glycerol-3-phosphate acyltransferase
VSSVAWFYRKYFRVETTGIENIPKGRCLIIGNHGGQVPIDAMLVTASLLLEGNPPRLARGMVERWAPSLPWISTFFARCGQITGDVRNCRDLLENDECVMVFPEGVGGSGKTIFHRYELQRFGTGFVRLALETKSPIVPTAVIGMEESLPSISGLAPLAKSLGIPYIPVVPTGPIPLPTKVTIRYGAPLLLSGDPDAPDSEVERLVEQVKNALRFEIEAGLKIRGEKIFTGAAK